MGKGRKPSFGTKGPQTFTAGNEGEPPMSSSALANRSRRVVHGLSQFNPYGIRVGFGPGLEEDGFFGKKKRRRARRRA